MNIIQIIIIIGTISLALSLLIAISLFIPGEDDDWLPPDKDLEEKCKKK